MGPKLATPSAAIGGWRSKNATAQASVSARVVVATLVSASTSRPVPTAQTNFVPPASRPPTSRPVIAPQYEARLGLTREDAVMSETLTTGHQPMEAVHESDRPWETLRWPGQWSKMLVHPRPERATQPHAGLR